MRRFQKPAKAPVFNAVANAGYQADVIAKFLTLAVQGSNEAIKKMLAEQGPGLLEARDADGRSALICAAQHGHNGSIAVLVKNGAEVDARDNDGRTALMAAAQKGFRAIAEALIDRGADMNLSDLLGQSVLQHAVTHRNNNDRQHPMSRSKKETISMLLARGARTDITDNKGHTPASWARHWGYNAAADVIDAEETRRAEDYQRQVAVFTEGLPAAITVTRLRLRRPGPGPG